MEEDNLIQERKDKFLAFLKTRYAWISYAFLAIIIFLAVKVRLLPTKLSSVTGKPGLWDISTNNWTLGPDLDPFLFLRWAKEIIVNGQLFAIDHMRYVPVGFNTKNEVLLHSYLIAWFHKFAAFFGSSSIEFSAIIYPVFMFGLTALVFFLLVRKIFIKDLGELYSNLLALLATFLLSFIPSLLPRTIAGIPEKEAPGFFFLFLSLYLFLLAWDGKSIKSRISFSILAALSTAMMAFVWGGFIYIYLVISIASLIALVLGTVKKENLQVYSIWLILSVIIIGSLSNRYSILTLLTSTTTLIPFAVFSMLIINYLISETKLSVYTQHERLSKFPKPILAIIISLLLGLLAALIFFGPGFVIDKAQDFLKPLIVPTTDRLGITVAENKQPYFNEWASSFGPSLYEVLYEVISAIPILSSLSSKLGDSLSRIPVIFWLFFIGSVYLYYMMLKVFDKKERIIATLGYAFFLTALIFSRYSASHTFNGTNGTSLIFALLGGLALISTFGYYYYQHFKKGELSRLENINFGLLMVFSLFFFSIVSARGAVRLIMVLVPSASILSSFLFITMLKKFREETRVGSKKTIGWISIILVGVLLFFSGQILYKQSASTAQNSVPSVYTQQWQLAMGWVRDNTPQNSVFAHWWDYGYWVQSMGERATVLDGGNSISYWNHLMGRYALTGSDKSEALKFLYSHNVTHLLIDSSDIGKYPAFSSIGSDVNYDRYTQLTILYRDDQQTFETKNSTKYLYAYGRASQNEFLAIPQDDDIFYEINGTQLSLPGQKTGVIGLLIERNSSGSLIGQPEGVFVYKGKQYILPLRYAFEDHFIDYGKGVKSGYFMIPRIVQNGNGYQVDKDGTLLYLSERTVNSQLAKFYLYNLKDDNFKLVHSQDDFFVEKLKRQTNLKSDFVVFQGVRGPIRIWEVNYPSGLSVNPDYLLLDFPNKNLTIVRK